MAAITTSMVIAISRPSTLSRCEIYPNIGVLSSDIRGASFPKLKSSCHTSSRSLRVEKMTTKAMSDFTEKKGLPGLPIDLRADDNGYGWAIAKSLAAAGAEILVGTWVPALNIFETNLRRGKFDESRVLPDGSLMNITKVYPLDAVYDTPEDVPNDVKSNKRYAGYSNWTVKVTKRLIETSRQGYLAAISASSYSFISLLQHFVPIMNPGSTSVSLTAFPSQRVLPGYGGGMSSAKAALESDTKVSTHISNIRSFIQVLLSFSHYNKRAQVLAFEAGRKHRIRVNTISAGSLRSRAAKATGIINMMIDYSLENAPLQKELLAEEVGNAAAFLASPLASAITGTVLYVDNGLNTMGVAVDSPVFTNSDGPSRQTF
ncbi:enoyl-ACP reductase 2 [Artemisia annua]|uniref:Enoyl-ACP reductase 2 n=1 Tax=Artemisia annua TaxID=35608 RepID=A0A2U1KDR0_ARTAN|nr:enoyl-ACP reductase 2 [Artemisia annua]